MTNNDIETALSLLSNCSIETTPNVYEKYGKAFGGVYLWEYMFAKPDGYTWANKMYNIFNPGLFTTIMKYLSLYKNI